LKKKNKNRIKALHKLNYIKHKEKILKKYHDNRFEKILKLKEWRKKNKRHIREYNKKYARKISKISVNYKIGMILRHRFRNAILKEHKSESVIKLTGCTISELKEHIESQFQQGMTWANHGKWHIDHIKPCSSFNLSDPEEQKKCFNYMNLQPLWAQDNYKKSDIYEK